MDSADGFGAYGGAGRGESGMGVPAPERDLLLDFLSDFRSSLNDSVTSQDRPQAYERTRRLSASPLLQPDTQHESPRPPGPGPQQLAPSVSTGVAAEGFPDTVSMPGVLENWQPWTESESAGASTITAVAPLTQIPWTAPDRREHPIYAAPRKRAGRHLVVIALTVTASLAAAAAYVTIHHASPARSAIGHPLVNAPIGVGHGKPPSAPESPLAGQSASQILTESLNGAQKAGSTHIDITLTAGGRTMTAQADVSGNAGTETVQFGPDHADMVIVNARFYLRANFGFLADEMNIPSATATKYANEWISIPQSGRGVGVTESTLLDLLNIADPAIGTTSSSGATLNGTLAPAVQKDDNPVGAPATLEVSNVYPFYPSSLTYSDPQGNNYQYSFSRWGEKTSLIAPTNAVSIG